MDGKKLSTANSSNPSLNSSGRRSSIDSTHSTKGSSTRNKLARLLPGRKAGRASIQNDSSPKNEAPIIDPKDLNLVDSGDDDLLTFDDDESSKLTSSRPDLSSHPSHAGFLTFSSPLIPAETVPILPSRQQSGQFGTISDRSPSLAAPTSARRSPSPARLKESTTPSKKNTSPTESGSGDSELKTKSRGVGRVGSLFGGRSQKKGDDSEPGPVFVANDTLSKRATAEDISLPNKALPALRSIVSSPPHIAVGPETLVTPPTPVDQQHPDTEVGNFSFRLPRRRSSTSEADSPGGEVLGHRRSRSAHNSSKLSQSIIPLTPAEEEIKTPGGTLSSPVPSTGFFSGFISAAQNAATSLSNSITVGSKNKSSSAVHEIGGEGGAEEVILSTKSVSSDADSKSERTRKPAIETLGLGNLSLSHLGIVDSKNPTPESSQVNLMETANNSSVAAAEAVAKKEDSAASKAVSKAYERQNGEKIAASPEQSRTVVANDDANIARPTVEADGGSIRRAGSVRSKISNGRRRTRGSSVNTTGQGSLPTARFTAAPPKRNRDFHNQFKSVPEDDQLIEDYAAALQREILLQGRLYVSEGHVCFWSNIFGYVTTLIISFDEIISVEKKSTAMIFQNGIVIQTLHARNVFASLLNRDVTYELIISIWKVTNPNLRSSLNGLPIEGGGTGDKTEKVADLNDDDSASEEIYDEDDEEDDEDRESYAEAVDHSPADSDQPETTKQMNRKVSANVAAALSASSPKSAEAAEALLNASGAKSDFPGPATHDPTDCGDSAAHYEKLLLDATVPSPLGKVFSLLFGTSSSTFMRKFLLESEKAWDFVAEENDEGLALDRKVRKFQYVRPLAGNPLGPKQTKCVITETLEQLDYEKAATVTCNTTNPDVPSGGSFVVKTRYCLMWAPANSTRMLITYTVFWTGRSLIKGPVESGVASGQLAYAKALTAYLTGATNKNSKTKASKKGGRRKRSADTSLSPEPALASQQSGNRPSDWGIFEPIHPVADIISSFAPPSSIVIGILLATVLSLWLRSPTKAAGHHRFSNVHGAGYYENAWKGEEQELWNWIEERVGMWDAIKMVPDPAKEPVKEKKKGAWEELENLGEQEVIEAIRVTKERLGVLERAVIGKKAKREED